MGGKFIDATRVACAVRVLVGEDVITIRPDGLAAWFAPEMTIAIPAVSSVRRIAPSDAIHWDKDRRAKDLPKWASKGLREERRNVLNWVEIEWRAEEGTRFELMMYVEYRRVFWDVQSGIDFAGAETARFVRALDSASQPQQDMIA